jgi:hypothetical protein
MVKHLVPDDVLFDLLLASAEFGLDGEAQKPAKARGACKQIVGDDPRTSVWKMPSISFILFIGEKSALYAPAPRR